ncbi:hypothetical protein PIB30_055802 [Stylosanthes scabra]|uniref:Thioglucosidase n=1 Tax=Stylosanthes scabra TaxID=79078 RepID=A0ABU6SK31_9FABA|nr:hypothetical protein [Stylosanthes scabra]
MEKVGMVAATEQSSATITGRARSSLCSAIFWVEDVKLMVEKGFEHYKFSISWSRLIWNGRVPINPKGLQIYNNLINEFISNGIQPHEILIILIFHRKMNMKMG